MLLAAVYFHMKWIEASLLKTATTVKMLEALQTMFVRFGLLRTRLGQWATVSFFHKPEWHQTLVHRTISPIIEWIGREGH